MNRAGAVDWKEEVQIEILESLLTHVPLQPVLVFKGAHVLNERLQEPGRRSLDIDSNLLQGFVQSTPDRTTQQAILERELQLAISRYFQSQSPVMYSLQKIHVKPRPSRLHPRGWDAYDVRISIIDHTRSGVLGLPSITLDIAAPEALRQNSIAPLRQNEATVWAYTLERITGEKLRAFLSSLPAYRTKVAKPGEAVRVKDVFDIARIHRKGLYMTTNSGLPLARSLKSHVRPVWLTAWGFSHSKRTLIPPDLPTRTIQLFRSRLPLMRPGIPYGMSWYFWSQFKLFPLSFP